MSSTPSATLTSSIYNKTTLVVAPVSLLLPVSYWQLKAHKPAALLQPQPTPFSHTTSAPRTTTTSRFFPPHHPVVLNHKLLHAAAREYLWNNAVDHLKRGARSWSARKNPKKLALRLDIVEEIEDGFSVLYWKKE